MRKIWNQVAYNLKKDRSSYLSFGIIIMITALILNCAGVLLLQAERAYDEKFDKLNTAQVNVLLPETQDTAALGAALGAFGRVERHRAILTEAVVREFNGTDFDMNTVFYPLGDQKTLNHYELVSKTDAQVENPIYIPLYVSRFGGFGLNDRIVYVIDGKEQVFTVAGIIEEMQYGNYGASMLCAYLPEESFESLAQEFSGKAVAEYSLATEGDLDQAKSEISKVLEDRGVTMLSCLDCQRVKEARNQVCKLLILILAAFAMIILTVSVFLSNFRVRNAIESEIVNMSVLKALGYTGGQIVAGISAPYAMVAAVFSLLGVGVSYLALPLLAAVLTAQSGFAFDIRFDWLSLLGVTAVLTAVVTAFTFFSAGKIRKTQPIDGLRGNSGGKQSKKNRLPLDTTRGNTHLLLVLKQMVACRKQNILLFLVCAALTVLTAFSGSLLFNVAIKPDNFMSALSDETPDVIIRPVDGAAEQLGAVLKADPSVENALQYLTGSGKIEEKTVKVFACRDFSQVRNDVCYRGKSPRAADEIALGSAFEERYRIGDTVEIQLRDMTRSFRVTGFVQSVNLQGELCQLTLEGYQTLCKEMPTPDLYVYLDSDADAAEVAARYKESGLVLDTVNAQKLQTEARSMYMGITVAAVAVIFAVTVLIVLFILYIVIKSLLVKRRQELGIYKAMGYTSAQLMAQTVASFLPVSAAAVLLSTGAAMLYLPGIYQVIFGALGVMKNNMEIDLGFLMLFALAQILVNVIISVILCMPIRKISAYALMKE